ncbi:MAG: ATP-binding cassette domain-containing protein [Brevinema sp.]
MLAELKNVSKKIADGAFERTLLDDITINLESNEVVALVGTSGAGKSALLRALSGLETIKTGEYIFNGTLMSNMPESGLANIRRKHMGFIGFEPEFLENMTVEECISMPLSGLSTPYKEQKRLINETLDVLGLGAKLKTDLSQLQYYERMYVAAARAFIKKPLLVVADDPTKKLHSNEALSFFNVLTTLQKEFGGTLVYSTYDPAHLQFASRIIYMKNGKIVRKESS